MKLFIFAVLIASMAFAVDINGCTEVGCAINPAPAGNPNMVLTVLNDWNIGTTLTLGIDVYESAEVSYVLAVEKTDMQIQAYDISTGSALGTLALNPANTACFGIAWNNNPDTDGYYTNDWIGFSLYYTEDFGASWATETNPAGGSGRGMDFDGVNYWETNGSNGGLWRFNPGVGQENIAIPEVSNQPAGLSTFPYNGNTGIALTTYNDPTIHFYEWDGTTMSYIGSAACPVSPIANSFGLAYCYATDTMFWTYKDNSNNYHLAEFSFELTALTRASWGSIKSSF